VFRAATFTEAKAPAKSQVERCEVEPFAGIVRVVLREKASSDSETEAEALLQGTP